MANIIATNVSQAGTAYTLAGTDVLIVARGIGLRSTADNTVVVSGTGNSILNNGAIRSDALDAVALTGNGNTLNNAGNILSGDDGVSVTGIGSNLVNSGAISGAWGMYLYSNGLDNTGQTTITNSGSISGFAEGITASLDQDLKITNSGLIVGGTAAGIQSTGANSRMTLVNSGRIIGDVKMGGDNDSYDGRGGSVVGDVLGEAGSDTFIAGASAERLFGGDGRDTLIFNSVGGVTASLDNTLVGTRGAAGDFYGGIEDITGSATGGDVLRGNAGSNLITGRGGNDVLRGVAGFDGLLGGAGADSLFGGAGSDEIFGEAGFDVLTGGADGDGFGLMALSHAGDRITDFSTGDAIFISDTTVVNGNLALGAVGSGRFITRADNVAQQLNDQFIFRTTDKTLWYDENGSAAGGLTLLFDLQAGAVLTAGDIVLFDLA